MAPKGNGAKKSDNQSNKKADEKALIGLTVAKNENFAEWYTQVIVKAELIEYYDVSGCYILRPNAYEVWETIQKFMDTNFKRRNIRNCYFPTFVTKAKLETEESHIEGFSAEVAWVTKSGQSDLAEPIAIRPTSETIMYPAYAKWIRSHRDLPLLLNQWNSVVRWEFKQPTPFIRTREFLWQEGHTVHMEADEARKFALDMLEVYRRTYEELLAVPVIPGRKSEMEKFAGGDTSYTVEAMIPTNGRGLQAATSHYLGTNFSKMFDIKFEEKPGEGFKFAHQCSFGFTTRSIGAMIMIHGDNKGLVMPPRVAPMKAVIVPIVRKNDDVNALNARCHEIGALLAEAGISHFVDDRAQYNPGWKYNHWELKGVPLRLEVGPRELSGNTIRMVKRYSGEAATIDFAKETTVNEVQKALDDIHDAMLSRAREQMEANIVTVTKLEDCMEKLNERKLIMAPWCGEEKCEEAVKKQTGVLSKELEEQTGMAGAMKTLCVPFQQPEMATGTQCFNGCGEAKVYCLWGRSY